MKRQISDAIFGAIAGDIIGSSYEFQGARFEPIKIFKYDCNYTDDTVLTIAIADWLATPGSNAQDKLQEWARKFSQVGYGPSFVKWIVQENPLPYNSCGNGSAMRVSAVGCVANSVEEALELAKESALPTHNHPEGVKGAQAVALAIFLARQGVEKEEIRSQLIAQFGYDLSRSYSQLFNDSYEFHVLCQDTVPEALICFFESDSYLDCVCKAMLINKDADTAACIAGSVAAAYYGLPLEIKERVLDYYLPESFVGVIKRLESCNRLSNRSYSL